MSILWRKMTQTRRSSKKPPIIAKIHTFHKMHRPVLGASDRNSTISSVSNTSACFVTFHQSTTHTKTRTTLKSYENHKTKRTVWMFTLFLRPSFEPLNQHLFIGDLLAVFHLTTATQCMWCETRKCFNENPHNKNLQRSLWP